MTRAFKLCPGCQAAVPVPAGRCPACGHVFAARVLVAVSAFVALVIGICYLVPALMNYEVDLAGQNPEEIAEIPATFGHANDHTFRQIKLGMSKGTVRQLLGRPNNMAATVGNATSWTYFIPKHTPGYIVFQGSAVSAVTLPTAQENAPPSDGKGHNR